MKIGHSLEDWGCCVVSFFHQSLASGANFLPMILGMIPVARNRTVGDFFHQRFGGNKGSETKNFNPIQLQIAGYRIASAPIP